MLRFIPPIIIGIGLAIMEVTAQARYGYFPTPWLVSMIATVISPWLVGMVTVAIGAYLFTMVDSRINFLTFIAYVINVLSWEDIWYWVIRWHAPYTWVFYVYGIGIPYVVYCGIPIITVTCLIISCVILVMEKSRYIIL